MKATLTLFFLGCALAVFSQEPKVYFDDAISEHLKSYNKECDAAIKNQNLDLVEVLFDSLKQNHLNGTLISKLKLKKVSGGYLETDAIKTPIILITKKTCFITNREEIKAINEIANQYKGKLEFIILYWDKKSAVKKVTKSFNKNVNIVYVNERDNNLESALSSIKNSFGVLSSFYITQSKELSNINRKFYLKNLKRSTKQEFFENTYKDITELLFENEKSKKETVISISDN